MNPSKFSTAVPSTIGDSERAIRSLKPIARKSNNTCAANHQEVCYKISQKDLNPTSNQSKPSDGDCMQLISSKKNICENGENIDGKEVGIQGKQ